MAMRAPTDLPPRHFSLASRRARWAVGLAAVLLALVVASAHDIASFYTDILWFGSVGFSSVWVKRFTAQLGLAASFSAILFALISLNLWLAERWAPLPATLAPGDQLVARWQELTYGRAAPVRFTVAALFALLGGVSTRSQWQNWELFSNAQAFSSATAPSQGLDPLNHLNDGFYVFRLPFLDWVTGWAFSALSLVFLLSLVAHYLNGGVRPYWSAQRVSPKVKAHLSVLLAALALVQGARYYLERLSLVLAHRYVVDGATYTDVHATRPALLLLVAISVIAAALFLYNARQQGWVLPVVATALWAFVWILVANVYPALVQSLAVNPAENVKEQPYIEDNIRATTWAYGLENAVSVPFQGSGTLTAGEVTGKSPSSLANEQSIANIALWQPDIPGLSSLFTKEQGFQSYYEMSWPSTDRYDMTGPNGKTRETQVLVSARELNPEGISPATWVNEHLQYTHGYGAVVVPDGSGGVGQDGYPIFSLSGLPPIGQPPLTRQPQIYFSTNPQLAKGYVVVDSDQPELDYENADGNQVAGHYEASGGVKADGFFRRLAFALSFGDYNILFSGQVGSSSRILYYRNVEQRLQKVAPFLTYDSDPYPVIDNGRLYWVVDAYTTSDYFPYSQQADRQRLPSSSNLAHEHFNYIRDSVKAVVDAYSGKMWFFIEDPADPVLRAWQSAFPGLFSSMSAANRDIPGITNHWRYPMDLFVVQTNMLQRYHQQDPSVFYNNSEAWGIAENPATDEVAAATSGAVGPRSKTPSSRAAESVMPMYELVALPGETQQSFVLVQPFVPSSPDGDRQNLTAFVTASSDPNSYGQLTEYTIPPGQSVDGPDLVTSAVQANSAISEEISLLNHAGSKVLLGHVDLTPIGQSLIYTQPLYVQQLNGVPKLDDVIVVYAGNAFHSGPSDPSIYKALCNVTNPGGGHPFASYCPSTPTRATASQAPTKPPVPSSSSTTTTTSAGAPALPASRYKSALFKYLAEAQRDFALANDALRKGDLATYQSDLQAGEALVALASKLAASPASPAQASPATAPSSQGRWPHASQQAPHASQQASATATTRSPRANPPKRATDHNG
jgi:uncharacterized membrane protein (UPF0182 family)